MDMKRKAIGTEIIQWTDTEQYRFQYIACEKRQKTIFWGWFTDCAPEGLACNQLYCVKRIHVGDEKKYPQYREYFDLMDFPGDNLREILARNPNACAVAEHLQKTGEPLPKSNCYVVEPAYESTDKLFINCHQYSVADRVDLILQYAKGCQQLYRHKIGNKEIDAHRDEKASNGVLDTRDGKRRIRLIDFASIHLAQEKHLVCSEGSTIKRSDHTLGVGMSPNNTTPEVLKGSAYQVSSKTDVYALGMMLAGLFFTSNQDYTPPSHLWVYQNGWESNETCDYRKLLKAFKYCEKNYEPNAAWNRTWVEQALEAHGIPFQWEILPSRSVLQEIRQLFFEATRICPDDRLSMDEFIIRLQKLLKPTPVSVYLIDQNDLETNRAIYIQSACSAFRQELEAAQRRDVMPPVALCVAHCRRPSSDIGTQSTLRLLSEHPVQTEAELSRLIAECPASTSCGSDMTVYALWKACVFMEQHNQNYVLSGLVHLFAPEVPAIEQMQPVQNQYNIYRFCQLMRSHLQVDRLFIRAYTLRESNAYEEDAPWFSRIPLSPTQVKKHTDDETDFVKPSPVKTTLSTDPVPQPKPVPKKDEDPFLTSATASYIYLDDDEGPYFIGKRK